MSSRVEEMAKFYDLLAGDYDAIAGYADPAAEELRAPIAKIFQEFVKGHDVLEIACGTGFWTEVIAGTANSVLATDLSNTMISLAQKRLAGYANVRCEVADAYNLETVTGTFTAACSHWWWSHIPKGKIPVFLRALHSRIADGASVLFADHLRGDWPDLKEDAAGDLVDVRTLKDGSTFEVVKNFPTRDEIVESLRDLACGIEYAEYPDGKMWTVSYRVKK